MKILLIADYYQSKISYAKSIVLQELKKQGHQVAVITSDRYFPFHNYIDTAGKILGPRIQNPGKRVEKGITVYRQKTKFEFFARAFYSGIEKIVKRFKPDIIIVFGIASPSAVQVARLRKKDPRITKRLLFADSHLPSELTLGNQVIKKIFYGLYRLFFSQLVASVGDTFIAVQDDTVLVEQQIYGISRHIKVIPNGTSTTMFYYDQSAGNKVRQQLKIKPKDFVVAYTGKLVTSKGIDILVKAMIKLWEKYPTMHCVLVGDGPSAYKESFLRLIPPKFETQIHLVGMVKSEQLYTYYSAADVGVWPLQESLAMIDAAACELPFIANHTLGAQERISNQNALLYKKGNSYDLAKKIEQLYLNPKLKNQMGRNGRKLVEQELRWEKIAKAYITS